MISEGRYETEQRSSSSRHLSCAYYYSVTWPCDPGSYLQQLPVELLGNRFGYCCYKMRATTYQLPPDCGGITAWP